MIFSQHLTDSGHAMCPVEDVIKVLHTTNVGLHLNTTETYHIYQEMKKGEPKLMTKHRQQQHFRFISVVRHPIDDVTLPIPTTPQLTEANTSLLQTTSMHTLINHLQNRKYTNNIIVI
jgi:hypothetical protein